MNGKKYQNYKAEKIDVSTFKTHFPEAQSWYNVLGFGFDTSIHSVKLWKCLQYMVSQF